MPTDKSFIIGTRGSLLALTQCNQVKEQLEKISGKKFDLKIIKTQGDQIVDKPLWQLDGKDFFTKELDRSLIDESVDLVVHSYKDLGSDRPQGIKLGAVTKRTYPHDVLLVKKDSIKKLQNKTFDQDFVVGTSSPRRISNLTSSLGEYLPGTPNIRCEMLRGNVNGRIQKLHDGNFDAICLAMAGLERLAITEESSKELVKLLEGLEVMILPLSIFPTAAAQGALAIEYSPKSKNAKELEGIFEKIHCSQTFEAVKKERESFVSYGGGCHLAVGIHVMSTPLGYIEIHKGEHQGKSINISKPEFNLNQKIIDYPTSTNIFIGLDTKKQFSTKYENIIFDHGLKRQHIPNINLRNDTIYVTSSHCLSSTVNEMLLTKNVFAAGAKTHKTLAKNNIFCHGGSDSLGEEYFLNLSDSEFLKLAIPQLNKANVLSHDQSTSKVGEVIGCYTHKKEFSKDFKEKIQNCEVYYWTSSTQYKYYKENISLNPSAHHYCGLGKTFDTLKEQLTNLIPVPNIDYILKK